MVNSTQDVSIKGEVSGNYAEVTSDNKLKVEAYLEENNTNLHKGKFLSVHLKNGSNYGLNIDGSGTPVEFTYTPPSGKKFYVSRMIIIMEDVSINHTKFGGIAGGITNGVTFEVTESGAERMLSEHPVKVNSEFYHLAYDVNIRSAATDVLSVRWSFYKSGTWLQLLNSTSDNVKVTVQDNLTAIDMFEVLIQGYEVDE